jgi:hypothetical protein
VETVFFPAVEEWRRYFRYEGKAVFLLDGLKPHHTDRFLQACSERNTTVVPHSSDQPLDLMKFALLK